MCIRDRYAWWLDLSHKTAAVSYTHLDMYKRQEEASGWYKETHLVSGIYRNCINRFSKQCTETEIEFRNTKWRVTTDVFCTRLHLSMEWILWHSFYTFSIAMSFCMFSIFKCNSGTGLRSAEWKVNIDKKWEESVQFLNILKNVSENTFFI